MDHEVETKSSFGRDPAELAWLAGARAGSSEAFSKLVAGHLGSLFALAKRLCGDSHWAEDLAQETLLRAFLALPKFRGDCSLKTWMFRILVRLFGEPSRWRKSERAEPLGDLEVPDRLDLDGASLAAGRELEDRVAAAIERLPIRQRAALHLRAVEGLDYDGIAKVLGGKPGAARMLVMEARRKLADRLGRHLEP